MMNVPRRIGMAITVAAHWRGSVDFSDSYGELGLSPAQADHFTAFKMCIAVCDRNIRKHARPREVATVVAEDIPEMRKYLRIVPKLLNASPLNIPQTQIRETLSDQEAGYIKQDGDIRVTRMRNSVHFVEKSEDPLVQVADACAYGIRRFFAKEKFGVEFVRPIFGNEIVLRDFASPGGCICYWPPQDSGNSY